MKKMASRKYLDHTADILFEAEGKTLEELFEQCGLAVEESQVDLDKVEPLEKKEWHSINPKVNALLFDFLDDLLFYKDAEQLIFSKFQVELKEVEGEYHFHVTAFGEKLNVDKHHPKVDVKAITMHMFQVKQTTSGWWAKVLIDI
ncbi:MAG: archease [Candidatus Woesearchaeota archaeon]